MVIGKISRRGFVAGGTAAASGLAAGSVAGASVATSDTASGVDEVASPAAFTIPAAVPGAQVSSVGISDVYAFTAGSGAAQPVNYVSDAGVWTSASRLTTAFPIPPGSTIHRVDGFGNTSADTTWILASTGLGTIDTHGDSIVAAADTELVVSFTPSNLVTTPHMPLGLYLVGMSSSSNRFYGATAYYTPPSQSLVLNDSIERAYDSRAGKSPTSVAKGRLTNSQERTIDLTVGGGLPAGATAALVNVTLANTSKEGYLALFPGGTAWPRNSTINFDHTGQIVANTTIVPVSATGTITARASGTTDFLIDVVGYYV